MTNTEETGMYERYDTVIVGAGQAGLAAGYHLTKRKVPFLILDANERIGDNWRNRWDSLRLFTPARYSRLPGLRFPAPSMSFPTKDEMGDYLETYAATFEMPVRTGVRVDRLSREDGRYVIESGDRRIEAEHVVVASGACQLPRTPAFAPDLDPAIRQLHSSMYRGPSQLRRDGVLVVGLGNSGAEIAKEAARTHRTFVSGSPSGEIPVRHGPAAARFVFPVVRFMGHHVLSLGTPIGRKLQPKLLTHAAPLVRVKTKDLAAAGVERVGRTVGARDGRPQLEDGRTLDVSNVIWCTGFREAFPWIDLPVFEENGRPRHDRGVVDASPGLYFMGLVFQYALSSDVIPGAGRDAEHIAEHIARRRAGPRRPPVAVNVGEERSS